MEGVSLISLLIVVPLVFFGGFVDSIAGGGGLITLPAYLVAGFPSHVALGTNKFASSMGTGIAFLKYAQQGYIKIKIAVFCAALSLIGSAIGTNLNLLIDDATLKIVLLVLLPFSAIFVFSSKGLLKERQPLGKVKTFIISGLTALIIGCYDGFYGPGTGTFIILFLTTFAHMKITEANGLCKAINLASNISSAVVLLINGKTLIVLALIAGLFQSVGNYIGSKLFIKNGSKIIRPIMIFVICLLFAKVLWDMLM